MKNEIKEILDKLKDYELRYKQCNENQFIIFYRDIHLLLDYITDLQHTEDLYNQLLKDYDELQQENNNLKTSLDESQEVVIELQQENERLNSQLKHYWKYRSDTDEQKEVYGILELGKDRKNLHKHKNTGGLLWIDLPMTLFSSLTSYIRARDVMLENYKSRIEKTVEYIENTPLYETTYDYNMEEELEIQNVSDETASNELLNILNGRSDE